MIYQTHQTENTSRSVIKKSIRVRSGAVPHLSKIVDMSHRGVLPETLSFGTLPPEGFIPPQYDNKSFVELHNQFMNLSNQFNNVTTEPTESAPETSQGTAEQPSFESSPAPSPSNLQE